MHNNAPSDAVSRVRQAWLLEAMALLGEGVPAARLEAVSLELGWPRGPLAELDEGGLADADALLHRELDGGAHAHHDHDHHDHGHAHDHGHVHHGHAHGDHGHGDAHHGHAGHVHGPDCDHGHAHAAPVQVVEIRRKAPDLHDAHAHADHGHAHAEPHVHGPDCDHGHAHDGHDHHDHAQAAPAVKRVSESAAYVIEKMAHGFGRLGRASGGGFYQHFDDGDAPELWDGLKVFERGARALDDIEIRARLLHAPAVEATRLLAENAVPDAAAFDREVVQAGAFPAALVGPLAYVGRSGIPAFVQTLDLLAERHGERFSPPAALRHAG